MAPSSIQSQNKPRAIEPSPAPVGSMPPDVVALICASVLIFLVFLSSGIVLIRRRLRHRTQRTTQVEAQAQGLPPVASESKEKVVVEDIFSPTSSSSKSCAEAPSLPPITSLHSSSTVMAEDLFKELMSKTSAALSKGDKYTTLPLRRSRQARRSKIEPKNTTFGLSTSLAALDAEIVNSKTSSVPAGQPSHRSSFMRSTSFASATDASSSANTPSRPEFQVYPVAVLPGTGDQSALRPSPTIVSMEARPLETDAAALPDAGTVFVSGSIPSFSSISSVISLRTVDGPTAIEAQAAGKHPFVSLDCETPRPKEHCAYAEKRSSGTPPSPSASVSTALTAQDTTFSSDADSVSEVGLGDIDDRTLKLGNVLSLPISTFNVSFSLSSDKGDDAIGLRPNPNSDSDDLSSLNEYAGSTKFEHRGLTTLAVADTF